MKFMMYSPCPFERKDVARYTISNYLRILWRCAVAVIPLTLRSTLSKKRRQLRGRKERSGTLRSNGVYRKSFNELFARKPKFTGHYTRNSVQGHFVFISITIYIKFPQITCHLLIYDREVDIQNLLYFY